MLFRSDDNLFEETQEFCFKAREIWIYSPFIRVNKIKEILDDPIKCKAIVVRWQTMDLLMGVTDFEELYKFCDDHSIALFRNTQIHLKAIRNEKNHILFGSANFTNMGMGINGNIELSGVNTDRNKEDIDYLNEILSKSILVDINYFEALKIDIDEKKRDFKKIEKIKDKDIKFVVNNKFLLDSLPQTESPDHLWQIYRSNFDPDNFTENEIICAKHDIQSYVGNRTSIITDKKMFIKMLRSGFNSTPFIYELKIQISKKANHIMGYTEIAKWISETTLSVPTPSRQDIRDKSWVNRLHNWIPALDSDNFMSEKRHKIDGGQGGTNLLHYIGKDHLHEFKDLEELIGGLRINRKGGKSPHQYIMLATINELVKNNEQDFSIDEVEAEFSKQWRNAGQLNEISKQNFAMPLNALEGQYINFNYINNSDTIQDYRKESEIKEKVKTISINKRLLDLFRTQKITSDEILEFY